MHSIPSLSRILLACLFAIGISLAPADEPDLVRELQTQAVRDKDPARWYWGPDPAKYSTSTSHSNRLIPVYTFGLTLESVSGEKSPYRDGSRLTEIFGRVPDGSLNPQAAYFDQTDVFRLQEAAVAAGKKRIILFIFDGMDWQTTRAAAISHSRQVGYREGRGTGLHWLDYRGTTTDFGYFSSAPHNDGTQVDVDAQAVKNPGGTSSGGYDASLGGPDPWTPGSDLQYLAGRTRERPHAITDSANSATSLTSGAKTFNGAINVDPQGRQSVPIARRLQAEQGMSVGIVTSVPISHATPAAGYANNVSRDDFQDLTRDLIGLPSVAHPEALPGVDVLLGCGWKQIIAQDAEQGRNFIPGNRYLADVDREKIDADRGGRYVIVERREGQVAKDALSAAAQQAAMGGQRLFGMFGASSRPYGDHLPYRTADGAYNPTIGIRGLSEEYRPEDVTENPTLADMTTAALEILWRDPEGCWLMVEAGDVDWANHDNNLDNSIGAVISGDEAVKVITDWVEAHDAWDETALIVTADHGHYLMLAQPGALTGTTMAAQASAP